MRQIGAGPQVEYETASGPTSRAARRPPRRLAGSTGPPFRVQTCVPGASPSWWVTTKSVPSSTKNAARTVPCPSHEVSRVSLSRRATASKSTESKASELSGQAALWNIEACQAGLRPPSWGSVAGSQSPSASGT